MLWLILPNNPLSKCQYNDEPFLVVLRSELIRVPVPLCQNHDSGSPKAPVQLFPPDLSYPDIVGRWRRPVNAVVRPQGTVRVCGPPKS